MARTGQEDWAPNLRTWFWENHFAPGVPLGFTAPHWPLHHWSLGRIAQEIGLDTEIECQAHRLEDPDYEASAHRHVTRLTMRQFLQAMEMCDGNDVYLTARNGAANQLATEGVFKAIGSLPPWIEPTPSKGFMWLGRDSVTPLHFDLTNNQIFQVMGRKVVRMFGPEQRDLLRPTTGVYSELGWVTDEECKELGLTPTDYIMDAGSALFIPRGYWHCVRSEGVSLSLTYTCFVWHNFWGHA